VRGGKDALSRNDETTLKMLAMSIMLRQQGPKHQRQYPRLETQRPVSRPQQHQATISRLKNADLHRHGAPRRIGGSVLLLEQAILIAIEVVFVQEPNLDNHQ
jgi:hypothetical protein